MSIFGDNKKCKIFVILTTAIALVLSLSVFGGCFFGNVGSVDAFDVETNLNKCDKNWVSTNATDGVNISVRTDIHAVVVVNAVVDAICVDYVYNEHFVVSVNETTNSVSIDVDNVDLVVTGIKDAFVIVRVPSSWSCSVDADVKTGGVLLDNIHGNNVNVDVNTGSIRVKNCNFSTLTLETNTGSVSVDGNFGVVNVENDTGSIAFNGTVDTSVTLCNSTGGINFDVDCDNVSATATTGSIVGTVHGDKAQYTIMTQTSTGSCNLENQTSQGTCLLKLKTSTGSINVGFQK